ncbi:MAG: 26S proteasome regulatory subunit T3, RPT3/PSMC4 [Amphiamblys sp. WSBS2006]|nr:MAG: 26S proteasome regulatory subunit T3, RPT3/PSMC4 [Amphiamblys sp. WSBS2006]
MDQYRTCVSLQEELDFLERYSGVLQTEIKILQGELGNANELKKIGAVPLMVGQFSEMVDDKTAIVQSTTGQSSVVRVRSTLDRALLKPNATVALHRHSNAVVEIMPPEADTSVTVMLEDERPDVTYADVGGLDVQKQEIREAVELPLTMLEMYTQLGIDPPRGVLLYGEPGTGKTMLVKAVANHSTATFIRVSGSEFVQKYLGEGPRMVRDIFRLAREKAPSIVFIDEVDAIATKRFDAQTGADREIQRVLIELLNQMDGFEQSLGVKVIMATNRVDTLDPALLRPGRLDRKIEFPTPDRRQKRLIFNTITSKMTLSSEIDMEDFVSRPEKLSGADIAAICQEAGMQAIRNNRYVVMYKDFETAYEKYTKKSASEFSFYT